VDRLTVKQFIVCDDVRREASGKEILIGVYGSGITVATFPAQLGLAFWMQFYTPETIIPATKLDFQLKGDDDAQFALVKVELAVTRAGLGSISLPTLPLSLQIPTHLILQMKEEGGEWKTVGEFFVEKGVVSQLTPPPGLFPAP
jgi:hypothetical protein